MQSSDKIFFELQPMTVAMDQGKKKLKRKFENQQNLAETETKKAKLPTNSNVPPAKKAKPSTDTQNSFAKKAKVGEIQPAVAPNPSGVKPDGVVKKSKKRQKKKKKVTAAAGTTVTENGASVTPAVIGDSKKVPKKKKKFSKFKKVEEKSSTTVRLPVEAEAISCNWKNLLKTIESEKKPPKQNPSIFFRYLCLFVYTNRWPGPD